MLGKTDFDIISPTIYANLSANQLGFRPKSYTISYLIDFFHRLYTKLDFGKLLKFDCLVHCYRESLRQGFPPTTSRKTLKTQYWTQKPHLLKSSQNNGTNFQTQWSFINRITSTDRNPTRVFAQTSLFFVYGNILLDILMSTNFGFAVSFKVIEDNPVTLNIDVRRN